MANLRILRITPGGTKRGKDRTLINKSNNIISIGWSYIPNLIEKKKYTDFYEHVNTIETLHGNDKKKHIDYVAKVLWEFIHNTKIGDYVLIPRPALNGHDGTDLYIAKILSKIKFNKNTISQGCAYYRIAEWTKTPLKWRQSPYHPKKYGDITPALMHFMWNPSIRLKTYSLPCNQFIPEIIKQFKLNKN